MLTALIATTKRFYRHCDPAGMLFELNACSGGRSNLLEAFKVEIASMLKYKFIFAHDGNE